MSEFVQFPKVCQRATCQHDESNHYLGERESDGMEKRFNCLALYCTCKTYVPEVKEERR